MIALYVFAYILTGWIVASVCLAISMRYTNKREPLIEYVVPFIAWPLVVIVFAIKLIIDIIIWLGRITEKVISKLTKGGNK